MKRVRMPQVLKTKFRATPQLCFTSRMSFEFYCQLMLHRGIGTMHINIRSMDLFMRLYLDQVAWYCFNNENMCFQCGYILHKIPLMNLRVRCLRAAFSTINYLFSEHKRSLREKYQSDMHLMTINSRRRIAFSSAYIIH